MVLQERGRKRRGGRWERVKRVVGSVTGRSLLPRERPLQGDGGGHVGGACQRAYWQSVSKAAGRKRNNRSRDRSVPARKEKSTLLRIPGNEGERYVRWVLGRGSTVDMTRGGQERGDCGKNIKWHFVNVEAGWDCPSTAIGI